MMHEPGNVQFHLRCCLEEEREFPMNVIPEDTYRKFWERKFRGLLIFLLDQSGSMLQQVEVGGKTYTNGLMATAALNELIYTISNNISVDPVTGLLKDSCDILVLGYGDQVVPLLGGGRPAPVSVSELISKPTGYSKVEVGRNIQGRVIQVEENRPFWVTYSDRGSKRTEMAIALQQANQAIRTWLEGDKRRYQSFPPIVVNITDGMHYGSGNPVMEAARIRELATYDGHVLLFNCHLTSHGRQRIVFPQKTETISTQITDPDERDWAGQLFNMSSLIPRTIIRRAQNLYHVALEDQARGFIYNASPGDLMNFLRWGTQPNN